MVQGALTAATAGEEVVPASEYRAREASARTAAPARQEDHGSRAPARARLPDRRPKTVVALDLIGRRHPRARRRPAHLPLSARSCPAAPLVREDRTRSAQSKARLPRHEGARVPAPSHSGRGEGWRHDGRVAVDQPNTRWCSDALEISRDNSEKVRVALTLDRCDREAMEHIVTTGGITAEMSAT